MQAIMIAGAALIGLAALLMIFNGGGEEEAVVDESVVLTEQEETAAATMPADMPSVPIYPGSVLERVTENHSDSEQNYTLSLVTTDSVEDVNMWYRGALSSGGWAVTDDKNVGGYILLKGEQNNLTVFTQAASHSEAGKVLITERVRVR